MTRLLKFLILLIISGIIIIICLIGSNKGRVAISNFIEQYLAKETEYKVKLEGIKFSLPLIISVDKLIINDQSGKLADINHLSTSIKPSTILFPKKIKLKYILANSVNLYRLPTSVSKNSKNKSPAAISDLIVKKITVNTLLLPPEITSLNSQIAVAVSGGLSLNIAKGELDFNFEAMQGHSHPEFIWLPPPYRSGPDKKILKQVQDDLSGKRDECFHLKAEAKYYLAENKLNIIEAKLDSNLMQVTATTLIDLNSKELGGMVSFEGKNILSIFASDASKMPIADITGKIRLSGQLDSPILDVEGKLTTKFPANMTYFRFPELSFQSQIKIDGKSITAKVYGRQELAEINSELKYSNNILAINNLTIKGPKFTGNTNLTLDISNGIARGNSKILANDITLVRQYLPFLTGGHLNLEAIYSAGDNRKQAISLKTAIKDLLSNYGNIADINLDFNFTDARGLILAPSKLNLKGISWNNNYLQKLEFSALSVGDNIQLDSVIYSRGKKPLDLKLKGLLNYNARDNFSFTVNNLSGTVDKNKQVRLTSPINLNYTNNELKINAHNIKLDDGSLSAEALIMPDKISATATIINLDKVFLPVDLPAGFDESQISGKIELSGSQVLPILNSELEIKNINFSGKQERYRIKAIVKADSKHADIKSYIQKSDKKMADFEILLPVIFVLSPIMALSLNDDLPFSILLKISEPFNLLTLLPKITGQKIKGLVSGNIKATGTINSLSLQGKILLRSGSYQYERYGIKLQNITSDILASGQKIVISSLKAEDYKGKTIKGGGEVSLRENLPFKFNLSTNQFNLASNPYMQGGVNGNLELKGNKEKAKIKGQIEIGPLEIKIPEQLTPDVPELNIVKDIYENDLLNEKKSKLYPILLNIGVKTKNQVLVTGWGVNALLKGNLKIAGELSEPLINGKLTTIRGRYQQFGKILEVKRGELIFDGKIPPSPYVNIVGAANEANHEISLSLNGSIFNLDINIAVVPALGEEEALSLLLFGEHPEEISAFQALQLANSLNRLSGRGPGLNPLEAGRKALGIDDIRVQSDTNDKTKTTIGVGKYLTDQLYLEIDQGGESGIKTKVEVELTPKISIESINENNGKNTLGIKWRFDY